ncbi:MAG: lytic murein transglycosylase B [Cardiobacteriaceae bacterium]|nr:lytic murein transglycosylase B [Cardiobacteriaceae bacterium]
MKQALLAALGLALAHHAQASYLDHPEALAFMHDIAEKQGMDEYYLQTLLAAVSRDDSVLEKISRPAEKTKTWAEYRPIFLDDARIQNGVAFWNAHAETLARAEKEYGMDPAIIVAILGVETRYGKVTGSTPVFQALATLCFDYPKRAPFFCEQVDYFLRLSQRENVNPLRIKGSYAGAMGMAQFMPSSYYNDAIDYDGDGAINLWESPADAIGSIANYMKVRGWQAGGSLVYRLPALPDGHPLLEKHQPHLELAALRDDDTLKNDTNFIKWTDKHPGEKAGGLELMGTDGKEYWLTHNNFYVITRYNTSPLYAMAVIDLAKRIVEERQRNTP